MDSLLGFERAPKSDAEIERLRRVASQLRQADKLFIPTALADCKVASVKLESAVIEPVLLGEAAASSAAKRRASQSLDEHAFLHGPSGCGKSTLLSLIGGVLLPASGSIDLLGQDLGRLRATQRDRLRADHIGFIFQQFNLVPYLPVLDNVLLPCRFSARRRARAQAGDASLRGEAQRLLGHLDLAPDLWRRPATELQAKLTAPYPLLGAR